MYTQNISWAKERDAQYVSTVRCPGTHAAEAINASGDKGEESRDGQQGLCHSYGVFYYLVGLKILFFFPRFLLPPLISL